MKIRYVTNTARMSARRHIAVVGLPVARTRATAGRRHAPSLRETREEDGVVGEPHDRVVAEHVDAREGGRVWEVLVAERLGTGLVGGLLDLVVSLGSQQVTGLRCVAAGQLLEGFGGLGGLVRSGTRAARDRYDP